MRGPPQRSLLDRALVWRPRRALFSSVCWLGWGPGRTDTARLTGEYSANPRWEEIREYREVVELGGKRESSSQSGCSGSHKEEKPWTGQTDWPTGNNNCHCIRWPNRWRRSMTSFMVNRRDSLDQTSLVPVSVRWRNGASLLLSSHHTLIRLDFLDSEKTHGFLLWSWGFLQKKRGNAPNVDKRDMR